MSRNYLPSISITLLLLVHVSFAIILRFGFGNFGNQDFGVHQPITREDNEYASCSNNISAPGPFPAYKYKMCSDNPNKKCNSKQPSQCTVPCMARGEVCTPRNRCCPLEPRNSLGGALVNYCRKYLFVSVCRICASYRARCGGNRFPCCKGFECIRNTCVDSNSCNTKVNRKDILINNKSYVSKYCTDSSQKSTPEGYTLECQTPRSKICTKCALPGTRCMKHLDCCQNTLPRGEAFGSYRSRCVHGICDFCGAPFKSCEGGDGSCCNQGNTCQNNYCLPAGNETHVEMV